MQIFISGGCKNGKSTYAQNLAISRQASPLYYIATMTPFDEEDKKRVKAHRLEREGQGFITIEQPQNIEGILEKCDHNGSFLLDSLTALLANEMFGEPCGKSCGKYDENAAKRVADGITQVLDKLRNIVIVSDYIYSDAEIYDPLTEAYRKSLARLDRLVASHSDMVLEVVYAQVITHIGGSVSASACQRGSK